MNNSIVYVNSSVTVTDAVKMMKNLGISSIVILEKNIPIRIITDQDFAIKIMDHSYPIDTHVKRIMASPLISIDSNSNLWLASDLMLTRNIQKLPVIDNDEVIGIITLHDLIKYVADD